MQCDTITWLFTLTILFMGLYHVVTIWVRFPSCKTHIFQCIDTGHQTILLPSLGLVTLVCIEENKMVAWCLRSTRSFFCRAENIIVYNETLGARNVPYRVALCGTKTGFIDIKISSFISAFYSDCFLRKFKNTVWYSWKLNVNSTLLNTQQYWRHWY